MAFNFDQPEDVVVTSVINFYIFLSFGGKKYINAGTFSCRNHYELGWNLN
jgi:hypothetical protein